MQALKTRRIDIILLGGAGALFFGLGLRSVIGGLGEAATPAFPEAAAAGRYEPVALKSPETATDVWSAPVSDGGDGGWIFDVFTPPVIYYDVANHKFSVTPPDTEMGEARGLQPVFGLELVEVKRTPYRIQLVGYVGSEGDYIATFEDVEAGGTFLTRPGRTIEAAGIVLRSFNVEKVRDSSGGGTVVQDTRATAVIRDLRQDRDVILVQKERLMNDTPTAVLRLGGGLSGNVHARPGDTIATADAAYTVGLITFDPPAAEVTRLARGDRSAEVRRLEPVPFAVDPQQPDASPGFVFPGTAAEIYPFGEP